MTKLIPYGHQLIDDDDVKSVIKVLKSGWLTQGPTILKFEKKLASYVKSKYAVAVSSGTAALHLSCLAAGIGPSDEVIVPTLSFVATANCVLYCGAKPVLVDIYNDTLTIDVEETKKKITEKTKAIIAVDFAGHPAGWDKLKELAKKYNLILIDDAAHAVGSQYQGKMIGSIVDLTCFSFHPVKTITTGEGGAITTNNKVYFERLKRLRHHGIYKNSILSKKYGGWFYQINELGYNYRMTDIQAALGISQLKKIDKFIKRRREIWQKYNKALGKIKGLTLPKEKRGSFSAWHLYTLRIDEKVLGKTRKKLYDQLRNADIGVQVHYIPIHMHDLYRKRFGVKGDDFRVAEQYYKEAISLPIFPKLTNQEQEFVIKILRKIIGTQ